MVSPASLLYQEIKRLVVTVLQAYVEQHDLGTVLDAPFQMRLAELRRGREPDVLFVAKEHLDRLTQTYLDGPADVVIEIVSPESGPRDRGEKYYEYEAAGVREYWLIDPDRQHAEFYRLQQKRYKLIPPDAQGIYRSEVIPGFWLNVNWLWQRPLPRFLEVLKALKLV
ncbi:MAG: Uma2 family endonuclease [Candidatus Bipolaricaulota bacterium]|nr:Uma2 family endonuclease [Candidatus Bipolaricaulota bacterium]MDW8031006.1 Uma2 family endonuclease [Candidatus Bipolaricaulota bacterium]